MIQHATYALHASAATLTNTAQTYSATTPDMCGAHYTTKWDTGEYAMSDDNTTTKTMRRRKTAQDRMKDIQTRPRVKAWHRRIAEMRNTRPNGLRAYKRTVYT